MGTITIDDVSVFLPDIPIGPGFLQKLFPYIERAGEGLRFLWLHDLDFVEVSAVFVQPDRRTITHTWGLDFSGYGAVISQGSIIADDQKNGFTITGRVGFTGADALLWGENVMISNLGVMEFTVRHNGGFDLAERLDSGVKFRFDHEFESEESARENGFILTATSRVIGADKAMDLHVVFDPSNKKLSVYLPENHTFASSLIGISGKTVQLKAASGAHWTLAQAAAHKYGGGSFYMRYYLTLAGCFTPVFSGKDKTILPGLSGTEYFDLSPLENEVIEFVPTATGAHICYPKGTHYYSQPTDAPLFAPTETGGDGLESFAVPLLTMDGNTSVPQMCYREIGDLPAPDLESVIYAERFDTLCKWVNLTRRRNVSITRAVSPQGLMVGVQSNAWAYVSLANVGTVSSEKLLRLDNIDLALRKSFADIHMNLVFEKPAELTPYVAADSLFAFCLENMWTINLNPASWNETSMLIIKYGTDSTIRELCSGKKAFMHALSKTLDADGKTADEFKPFLEMLDDPKFTGVFALGLKLTVDETRLNAGIKTAWLGISEPDREAMRAHHLMIRHTKLSLTSGKIAQKSAAVDALVYYRADKGLSYGNDYKAKDYDFQTTALTLEIKNSKLKKFATESELLINQITDSRCQKDGGNCLFLDGRADSTSGLDGFAFALRGEGFYTMKSPLEAVRITGVSLAGESVFSLGGKLYFAHDERSDLFSFGFDGEDDFGLNFFGWKIRKMKSGVFAAEYGDISLLQSEPRKNSWAERFPVGIDTFCHDIGRAPVKCGYVDIKTTLPQKKIGVPWYGIRFRVPLGSLGDLSENSMLDLHILAAWSGGDHPGLYVGMRDNLMGGIDVQGLIKLGFDTVELESALNGGRMRFRLSLKQFTARFLWASFPPGTNRIVIEADDTGKKLGWLGEYRDKEGKSDGDQ